MQTSPTSITTMTGAAASGYDCLKPRLSTTMMIPTLETAASFSPHPTTNPYVETPTSKCPISLGYPIEGEELMLALQNTSFDDVDQEMNRLLQTVENFNQNNNSPPDMETSFNNDSIDITSLSL